MPFTNQLMTDRQRFQAIMHYQPFDRGYLRDFAAWKETADVWHEYGMARTNPFSPRWGEFFGFDPYTDALWTRMDLFPPLERKVLKDEGETLIVQEDDGSIVRAQKYGGSMPTFLDHLLKDRASWEKHFKWRLDPDYAGRTDADLEQQLRKHVNRDYPVEIYCGSTFGRLRDWMGLEGVSYIQYDDPGLFVEMLQTMGDCMVRTLERTLAIASKVGLVFDFGCMWEDMSYAQGPLLSVEKFKQYLVPQYKRISALLRRHGTDLLLVDSDGDVRLLLPHWLEGGVNIMFPMEVGTWGLDVVEIRRQYGRELRLAGGFDKHILARGKDDITREIERLAPLVEEGGFIPFCDHRVPPDVSFENYLHYVEQAKKIWGRGLPNLRPTARPDSSAPRFGQAYDYRAVIGDAAAAH